VKPLEAALQYAAAGLPVLPIYSTKGSVCSCDKGASCPQPGKHPTTFNGLNAATTDEKSVRNYWELFPEHNVAVVVPKGYAVVDIDPRNGGDNVWDLLEKEYGEQNTLTAETGGSGFHLWFKVSEPLAKPGEGIDIKQGGTGYVLVYPSVHASGQQYQWAGGFDLARAAEAPKWLATQPERGKSEEGEVFALSVTDETILSVKRLLEPRWAAGNRQEWALPFFGYLAKCGWDAEARHLLVDALGGEKKEKYEDIAQRALPMDGAGRVASSWPEWPSLDAAIRGPLDAYVQSSFAGALDTMTEDGEASPTPGFSSFATIKPRAIQFVVRELEIGGDVRPGLMSGLPNGGKTPLCLYLALCVVFDKPFLGYPIEGSGGKVLCVFFEGSQNLVLLRLLRLARGMGISDSELEEAYSSGRLKLLYTNGGPLTGLQEMETILNLCKAEQYKLGIVDTLTSALDSSVDINTPQARAPLNVLSKITELTKVPWIMTVHTPKSGDGVFKTMGSTAIAGAADTIHSLENIGSDKNKLRLTVTRAVMRGAAPIAFEFVDSSEHDFELDASHALSIEVIDAADAAAELEAKKLEEARDKRAFKEKLAAEAMDEKIAAYVERVMGCFDVPRTQNEVSKMLVIDTKLLKHVLDFLTRQGNLVMDRGRFQRTGWKDE
jgi:hypothetical protein